MALRFFWRCEGTTMPSDGGQSDQSCGDTTAAATGTPTIIPGAARVGTNGLEFTGSTQYYAFNNANLLHWIDARNMLVGAAAFSIRWPTALATTSFIPLLLLRGNNSNNYIRMETSGTQGGLALTVRREGFSPTSGEANTNNHLMEVGLWYGMVARWDQPKGKMKMELYDASNALLTEKESLTSFVAPAELTFNTGLRIGPSTGDVGTVQMDNVFLGDTYDEPLQNHLTITQCADYIGNNLTFFWGCEGTTHEVVNDYTNGDDTAESTGTPSLSSAAARTGNTGILINGDTEYYSRVPNSVWSRFRGSLAFSLRYATAHPPTLIGLYGVKGTGAGDDSIWILSGNTGMSGTLRFHISTATPLSEVNLDLTTVLSTGVWYGVIARWDHANHRRSFELYNDNNVLLEKGEDIVTPWEPPVLFNSTTGFRVGYNSTGLTGNIHFDTCMVSGAYDEPLQNNLTRTTYADYVRGPRLVLLSSGIAA